MSRIMLPWEDMKIGIGGFRARTPFGDYHCYDISGYGDYGDSSFEWRCPGNRLIPLGNRVVSSLDEAKAKCQEDWDKRIEELDRM